VVGLPARVKILSAVQNSKPSLYTPVILFREKKGLFQQGLRGWGVKLTIYFYPARQLRSYEHLEYRLLGWLDWRWVPIQPGQQTVI